MSAAQRTNSPMQGAPSGDARAGAAWMTPEQVADLLQLSVKTLAHWRVNGTGPRYARLARFIRYRRADVEAFMADRLRHSTYGDGGREEARVR